MELTGKSESSLPIMGRSTLPETNSKFAPENGELEDDVFLGGETLMETLLNRCKLAVSFNGGFHHGNPLPFEAARTALRVDDTEDWALV